MWLRSESHFVSIRWIIDFLISKGHEFYEYLFDRKQWNLQTSSTYLYPLNLGLNQPCSFKCEWKSASFKKFFVACWGIETQRSYWTIRFLIWDLIQFFHQTCNPVVANIRDALWYHFCFVACLDIKIMASPKFFCNSRSRYFIKGYWQLVGWGFICGTRKKFLDKKIYWVWKELDC